MTCPDEKILAAQACSRNLPASLCDFRGVTLMPCMITLRPAALFASAVITFTAGAGAAESLMEQPRPLARSETNVGRMMPDIRVTDIDGRSSSLKALAAKHKALAVAFTSPTCPLSAKL